ncbi:MAG TPA: alpha/beta fold hydrolase, partial [Gammaproteobacteria bacterium]|nr:alpha/beta fold hydrolase [Gammaproteobacteria bacterium]
MKLFVARIASQSANPRPDPLLVITGGPGQSTVDFYLEARGAFEPTRRERELILVDQRGTGRSAEGFGCNVPDDLALETAGAPALMAFLDKCISGLRHDPRFYSTSVAVQDLDRVRAALGIEQWDVYGISYGTRVAQHYLRRFPDRVRAIVLDGVVPPDLALGPDVAREAQRALDRIFERCAADARCAARFPGLPAEFKALLAKLASDPVDMPEPTATAGDMQSR